MDAIKRLIEAVGRESTARGRCLCGAFVSINGTVGHADGCPLEAARKEYAALTNTNRERYAVSANGRSIWDSVERVSVTPEGVVNILNRQTFDQQTDYEDVLRAVCAAVEAHLDHSTFRQDSSGCWSCGHAVGGGHRKECAYNNTRKALRARVREAGELLSANETGKAPTARDHLISALETIRDDDDGEIVRDGDESGTWLSCRRCERAQGTADAALSGTWSEPSAAQQALEVLNKAARLLLDEVQTPTEAGVMLCCGGTEEHAADCRLERRIEEVREAMRLAQPHLPTNENASGGSR